MAPKNINNIKSLMGANGKSYAPGSYGGRVFNETIDERILRLLGLENEFELSYEEYVRHLKEALSVISLGRSRFSTEEAILFQTEFRRVKSKKKEDRFKVKKKKITASNVGLKKSSAIVKAQKLSRTVIKPERARPAEKAEARSDRSIADNLRGINKTLDKVLKSLIGQNKDDKKRREKDRTSSEKRKAQERESDLEKPFQVVKNLANKIIQPFRGILDSVFRFLGFTFLGWMVGKFDEIQKWTGQNKGKIETVTRFLKDWWPSIAVAAGLFLTPLGGFIRGTLKMLRVFVPQIARFLAANPMVAGLSLATIGGIAKIKESERMKPDVDKTQADINKTLQSKDAPWYQKLGAGFANQSLNAPGGPKNPIGLSMPGSMYASGGAIGRYFSGLVGRNTGATVSGFGKDTQAFALAGGGTAVLQPGETVLQVGARERMINQTGLDPLSFNVGPNANKPRHFGYQNGGIVGMQGGGILGALGKLGSAISQIGKPRGLGFGGARAGFTGMNKQGFEAIMSGAKFRNPNRASLIGKGSRPVLGHGAYSAPTARGASRYVGPGGGIVKSIVPGGARGINFIEPQSVVKPSTFDKGKLLADKLLRGAYSNSPLANRLRNQLISGTAQTALGGAKLGSKLFGALGPILDLAFPEGVGTYSELSGPNAYYNAPGYRGPRPVGYEGGGPVSGGMLGFKRTFGAPIGRSLSATGSFYGGSSKGTEYSASGSLGMGTVSGQGDIISEGITKALENLGQIADTSTIRKGLIGGLNLNISGGASNNQPKPKVTTPEESPKTSTPSGQTTLTAAPGQQSISPPGPSEAEKEAYRKDVMDSYTYGSGYYEKAGDAYDPAKVKAAMEARDRDKRIADYRLKHGFNKGGLARFFKAGTVSTTTGFDIRGGVMGADTQYTPPMALKPGEDMYIIPSQAAPYMDKMVAKFDRNSNPAKNHGNLKKSGPSVSFMDLPPNIIGGPKGSGGDSQPGKPQIKEIDVLMKTPLRMRVAEHLGIEDLV